MLSLKKILAVMAVKRTALMKMWHTIKAEKFRNYLVVVSEKVHMKKKGCVNWLPKATCIYNG